MPGCNAIRLPFNIVQKENFTNSITCKIRQLSTTRLFGPSQCEGVLDNQAITSLSFLPAFSVPKHTPVTDKRLLSLHPILQALCHGETIVTK